MLVKCNTGFVTLPIVLVVQVGPPIVVPCISVPLFPLPLLSSAILPLPSFNVHQPSIGEGSTSIFQVIDVLIGLEQVVDVGPHPLVFQLNIVPAGELAVNVTFSDSVFP